MASTTDNPKGSRGAVARRTPAVRIRTGRSSTNPRKRTEGATPSSGRHRPQLDLLRSAASEVERPPFLRESAQRPYLKSRPGLLLPLEPLSNQNYATPQPRRGCIGPFPAGRNPRRDDLALQPGLPGDEFADGNLAIDGLG